MTKRILQVSKIARMKTTLMSNQINNVVSILPNKISAFDFILFKIDNLLLNVYQELF